MSINHWRQSFVAWVAPVLAAAISIGNTAAFAGHGSDCPCRVAPSQSCNCPSECDPSAPAVPSDAVIDPAMTQPPADSGFSSNFDDTDFSTGLATNFGGGGATSAAYAAPGYIDPAKIQNRVRIRYDNAQGANAPTRGLFLYPSLGAFGGNGPPDGGGGAAFGAEVDIEEVTTYIELAFRDRFSVFIDVPIRWIDPIAFNGAPGFEDGTQRGAGNISTGFRWGWINCPDEHLTFQLRTSLPTGEPLRAIGNGVTSIDIGLLYDQKIGRKTRFYAELNDWQTLDAVDLDPALVAAGSQLSQDANIVRFGLGLGYDVLQYGSRSKQKTLTLLAECVTWTVLDGVTTSLDPNNNVVVDATGDTIVNGKYGARYTHGDNSIYVGYGHNWTRDRWYSDLLRLEWQRTF